MTIRGSALYIDEFSPALELLAGGRIEPLDQFAAVYEEMRSPEGAVKYLLRP